MHWLGFAVAFSSVWQAESSSVMSNVDRGEISSHAIC